MRLWLLSKALLFSIVFLKESSASPDEEVFQEELTIKPLPDGKVSTTFAFQTLLRGAVPRNPQTLHLEDKPQHYTKFPLALGQILREYAVTELHLTLNAGRWNYERWGYPIESGVGTGAELWVWMGDGPTVSIDHRWQGLRNALAGLFCASLGSLDEQRTTSPPAAFMPVGSLPDWGQRHQVRHASLASEHVCTENLTPFLKLLPCKSRSGIAALLNPHRVFDADWHGMGVHVVWNPNEGVEVRLTFQAVFDPLRASYIKRRDWSFSSLFDRTIEIPCAIAESSRVLVTTPNVETFVLEPRPTSLDGNKAEYRIGEGSFRKLDASMRWPEESNFDYPLGPLEQALVPLNVWRTLKGPSQDHGQLSVTLRNAAPSEMRVIYLETMPWLVQFYLHTLRVTLAGVPRDDLLTNMSYVTPVPHSRPCTFQAVLTIPPKSTVRVSMEVDKAFLRYTEHPPDAQRGWDLPPAVLVPIETKGDMNLLPRRIYTPALLVDLATPDFSMPYNVIIFTCSLIAFIFGSVFNLLTRTFVVIRLAS